MHRAPSEDRVVRERSRPTRSRRPGAAARALLLPTVLITAIVVLLAWRTLGGSGHDADAKPVDAGGGVGARPELTTRGWRDASLEVPRSWVELSRGSEYVTWGSADRTHTVTLGSTPASVLPLPGVVQRAVRQAARELPGATAVDTLELVDLDRAPEADAVVAAGLVVAVPTGARASDAGREQQLHVRQVWRRDSVGERDLVATWTSSDGRWPVDPTRNVPVPSVR